MNCQEICKISPKRLNRSANIPKSFRGLLFLKHTVSHLALCTVIKLLIQRWWVSLGYPGFFNGLTIQGTKWGLEGRSSRPERPRAESAVLGKGPFLRARGSEERCKLPQRDPGLIPFRLKVSLQLLSWHLKLFLPVCECDLTDVSMSHVVGRDCLPKQTWDSLLGNPVFW